MASKTPPATKRTRHSKFKALIPRAIEIKKTMDLGWRETAELLGREVGMTIPHASLFKAFKAWQYRQGQLETLPDILDTKTKTAQPMETTEPAVDDWPEDPPNTVQLPQVIVRKPR